MRNAEIGIAALKPVVDTLITIPNDKLIDLVGRASLPDALRVADDVLRQGIQGISDLIAVPAMINLDFADVKTIMKEKGLAHMGIGNANGEKRAAEAARQAIESPLLETSINGARGVLMNITGGPDLSLLEVNEAAEIIAESADPDANIIFGADIDEAMGDSLRITVIATGFESERTIPQAPAGNMFGGGLDLHAVRLPAAATAAGGLPAAVRVPRARAAAAAAAAALLLRGAMRHAAPSRRKNPRQNRLRSAARRRSARATCAGTTTKSPKTSWTCRRSCASKRSAAPPAVVPTCASLPIRAGRSPLFALYLPRPAHKPEKGTSPHAIHPHDDPSQLSSLPRALALLDELRAERPDYAAIPLQIEDESRNKALADSLDYWYVPCCFVGGKKLHEGVPSREAMRAVLDAALLDGPKG